MKFCSIAFEASENQTYLILKCLEIEIEKFKKDYFADFPYRAKCVYPESVEPVNSSRRFLVLTSYNRKRGK